MPQAEHLGVPETQVAGDTASTASADELSREVLHQNNLSEDSRNIYFLKDAPVMRALLALGIPMATGLAITAIYNVVNSYFVGHFGTVEDLAALIFGFPVVGVITALAGLFGVGASTLTARLLGEGNTARIPTVTSFAVYASLIFGVGLAVAGIFFVDPLTRLMGAGGATYEPTRWFVTVLFLGAPPWMCMFTLEQLVRAEGYAKQSMYGLLWGVLANLVLDVLLIGVLHMGAAGSGWALMGTNVACIIYYMLFLTAKSKNFSWSLKDFTLSADVLKPVLSVGSSQMVSSLFLVVSALVLNNLAVKYGDAAVASFGVSIRLIMVPQTVYGYLHGQYSTFCIYLRCGESGSSARRTQGCGAALGRNLGSVLDSGLGVPRLGAVSCGWPQHHHGGGSGAHRPAFLNCFLCVSNVARRLVPSLR